MNEVCKLDAARRQAKNLAAFRAWLFEQGYNIFPPSPDIRQHSDLDIIAVSTVGRTASVFHIFPSAHGSLVVRSCCADAEHHLQQLRIALRRSAEISPKAKAYRRWKLRWSKKYPGGRETKEWIDFLSPEGQEEARLLKLAA